MAGAGAEPAGAGGAGAAPGARLTERPAPSSSALWLIIRLADPGTSVALLWLLYVLSLKTAFGSSKAEIT